MSVPTVTTGPTAAAGFDPDRLERIDRHFARYVDDGRLPGIQVVVSRRGQVVHASTHGRRSIERNEPWDADTVVRLFSMTKPLTSVAAMMLYEEGAFQLKDPVRDFLPEFGDTPVFRSGSFVSPIVDPQSEPMRIWHLLTHTSGLTYGFLNSHPTDALYRQAGFEWGAPDGLDLAECCARWAALPLVFQPGTEWNYGVSTDVLGRLVEVVSGQPLDEFLRSRVLDPLGMVDTDFWVPDERRDRFADLYVPHPANGLAMPAPASLAAPLNERPAMLSGGGGLCGTAADYLRFTHLLLGKGELDGTRLLGSRTVDYMTRNHLPGDADLEAFGRPLFAETTFDGVGFGLGFSVVLDSAKYKVPTTEGSFAWGGAASTAFWVDPTEEIVVLFLTQLLPSSTHPIRAELAQLVYQALVD
ncbi:MAG: serine hydrolase domain-containing protein [Ilumatobacteraceae bacterium]